jgi:prepilin-type N-terminal cleavage/methylation domain-containing protein
MTALRPPAQSSSGLAPLSSPRQSRSRILPLSTPRQSGKMPLLLSRRRAFTLIELLLAVFMASILLAALYALFGRVVHLREQAAAHERDTRLRAHALAVLRNDLMNARVSGGLMAATLDGETTSTISTFPGYLHFTTTTGRDDADNQFGDTQEVEYYVDTDPNTGSATSGQLVRMVYRVVLAETRTISSEDKLLSGVTSMELSFFDGTEWNDTWQVTDDAPDLPLAVRVTIHLEAPDKTSSVPAPIEVLVPWESQRAISTTTTAATGTTP